MIKKTNSGVLTGVGFNFDNILCDKFKYVLSNFQPILFLNIFLSSHISFIKQ